MSNMEVQMSTTPAVAHAASSSSSSSKVNKFFAASLKGFFRIAEMVFSLVAFICATVGRNNLKYTDYTFKKIDGGAGWCMFVSMFSFLLFLLSYFLWLFFVLDKLTPKLPVRFTEFVTLAIFAGFYLIAGIVAASFAKHSSGLGAAAFFNFAMMIVCAVDAFFHYRDWSGSDEGPYSCGGGSGSGGAGATTGAGAAGTAYPTTGHNTTPAAAEAPKY